MKSAKEELTHAEKNIDSKQIKTETSVVMILQN